MTEETPLVDFVGLGLNAADTLIQLPSFPSPDSKVEFLSHRLYLGGQVATAAIACHRWGWRTRYIGKVGDDEAARLHREAFTQEGLEAHLISVPDCESQLSYIFVDESSGERTILWKRDPRLNLEVKELHQDWITRSKLLHVDGHPCEPAIAAAQWAKKAGTIVTADLDNLYPEAEALLENVDYAITSREFPERLTGISDLLQSLPAISDKFGCRVTTATLGSKGVLAWDGSAFHYCPAFQLNAVDTTGAGDVFHAGIAHALLRGEPLEYALEFACAAAALNCTAPGARGNIAPLDEIEYLMSAGIRGKPLFRAEELKRHTSSK